MPKPLDRLSARELQALYDKTFAIAHESTKALCATGRGNERGSETRAKNDPLALAYIRTHDAFQAVADEQAARRRYHGSDKPIKRKES